MKEKAVKKIIIKKIVVLKGHKKDNSKNVNSNNDKDKDKDNLINKLLNNKDKLHNFSDKVLNKLISIAKLKKIIN